jgi:tetratricopeptide (TPR) repeat protein
MTEDLTTDLSRISGLFVIARNSAFTYKRKAVKVEDVSQELGVQYVLEGSVRKENNRMRINAQLIDATAGHHIWAERYDREMKDLFALQDEITQKIVLALRVKLTKEEQEQFRRTPTDNLEAYDYFLRGKEPFYRYTKESNAQARQMLEKAVVLDPQFAGAYAWLAWTYWHDWVWHWTENPQNLERAFALAQKAVALDDSLPDGYHVLSFLYRKENKTEQALAQAQRGLTLAPNYPDSYQVLADILIFAGRPEDAIGFAEKAVRLDPRMVIFQFELGAAYLAAGRIEEAIATNKRILLQDPNFEFAYVVLALSSVLQWDWQLTQDPQTLSQALALARKVLTLNKDFPFAHVALGYVYLWQKQPEQAYAAAERAIALNPDLGNSYALLTMIQNATGQSAQAIKVAEKAIQIGIPDLYGSVYLGQAYCESGRYKEAIATLKPSVDRIPNLLHAHLFLTIAYSELGRETEARAAAAEILRINPNFSLEVMKQRAPYTDPTVVERQVLALRKAGMK